MIDIDALSGRGLKVAVVMALGYTPSEHPSGGNWFFDPGGSLSHISDFPDCPTDIAAAWELDGEGWEWIFDEHRGELVTQIYRHDSKHNEAVVVVQFSDFPTKSVAYATARCRAWLKAQQAERGAP